MNVHNHRALASLMLASYLLATAVGVLHHHHVDQHAHLLGSGSGCKHETAARHCHHDEADPHGHRPKDDHRPLPAEHDDCLICKYLSEKSLSALTVTVVQLVEQVIPFEPLPLAQPSDAFLAGYDCRGPPRVG